MNCWEVMLLAMVTILCANIPESAWPASHCVLVPSLAVDLGTCSPELSGTASVSLQPAGCAVDRTSSHELAFQENEALDQKLAHYKEREEEEDDEEAGEREGKQPDLQKDDMMVRRTGACQKPGMGPFFNRFLPLPAAHRGTPKTKTEGLHCAPKPKMESLSNIPKIETEAMADFPNIKSEGLAYNPNINSEGLADVLKTKTDAMPDTQKNTKGEILPDNLDREPLGDSLKSRGRMNPSSPKVRQDLRWAEPSG